MKKIFHNVFRNKNTLYSVNLDPGQRVYGERLNGEYREWDPNRSKLGAAIMKGMKTQPFTAKSVVLYLGAAQGTTPSHVSDIVDKGVEICVEISQKAFEKLLPLCERRENMVPVLADANQPEQYAEYTEGCNVLFQDVAQPNQAAIFVKNFTFKGYGLLAIKARSVNVAMRPEDVFDQEIKILQKAGIEILEVIDLAPYEKDPHNGCVQKMTIVDEIHDYVKEQCDKDTNPFGEDAYHVHFVDVAKYAEKMADVTGADKEIVMLAAWLHDVGSVMGYYDDHHIFGAKHAEELLKEKGYPAERIEMVKHAIVAHRGSKDVPRESVEAECVADADAMCHFDNIPSLFRLALVTKNMKTDEAILFVRGKLQRSWNKLTPKGKEIIKPKYDAAMVLLE